MSHAPLNNLRSPAALARFLVPAVIGLTIDLWTKYLAARHLAPTRDTIEFIPGWLHWTYTENRGAVFGSGQGLRWLFVAVSVLAIGFLVYLFTTSGRQRVYQVLLGILLAGVLGNLYDRVAYGYVRDMIHALPGWKWPGWMVRTLPDGSFWQWKHHDVFPWIFNVADTLLCVGVFLMIVYSVVHRPHDGAKDAEARSRMTNDQAPMTNPGAPGTKHQ
jgi:signal peptidase II